MATVNSVYTDPNSATLDKATGATIDETMMDALASNFRHIAGSAGYIACRAFNSVAQSLTNNVFTVCNLGSESFDSDPNGAMHDLVTNNSRVVIRTAGVYVVNLFVSVAANATGVRVATVRINGGSDAAQQHFAAAAGVASTATCSVVYAFNANDYVEATIFQNSGGALNVDSVVLAVAKL